jgi:2-aminoethylphosphonate-pyruvate transaminase
MTGPYHSIQSLEMVLEKYAKMKKAVLINKKLTLKKFKPFIVYPKINQPQLCTYLNCNIKKTSSKVILYQPRVKLNGSVICHLGEVHLGSNAKGKILDYLKIDKKK